MELICPFLDWPNFPKGIFKYAVSQKFGENPAFYAQYGHLGHNGWDMAAPLGTPVVAVHDGWIVEATARETGYGLRITQYFEEDGFGWDMIYGHFQKVNYPDIPWDINRRNYPVKRGQVIGYVDSTGNSSGNHLHFTLRKYINGQLNLNNGFQGAIDPAPYFTPMSNVKIAKRGQEYGYYIPCNSQEALISYGRNFARYIPTTNDHTVEFDKLVVEVDVTDR